MKQCGDGQKKGLGKGEQMEETWGMSVIVSMLKIKKNLW